MINMYDLLRYRKDFSSYEGKNFTTDIYIYIDLNRICPTQRDTEAIKANLSILVASVA